jgi:hypothetical protein
LQDEEERLRKKRECTKRWRRANPEKVKEENKRYRLKYRDKIAAAKKKWNLENKELNKKRARIDYEKNRDAILARGRKWRKANPERARNKCAEWHKKNKERVRELQRKSYLKNKDKRVAYSKEYYKNNKDLCRSLTKAWFAKNPDYQIKRNTALKKQSLCFKDLANFFALRKWTYSTPDKDSVTKDMVQISKELGIGGESSFLSLPNYGRELQLLKEAGLIDFSKSIGLEYKTDIFNSIWAYLKRFFPGYTVLKGDVNKYILGQRNKFDLAHLDYNGPLTIPAEIAIRKLSRDTLTFVTTQDNFRFHNLATGNVSDLNIIYDRKYTGKNSTKMRTQGIYIPG